MNFDTTNDQLLAFSVTHILAEFRYMNVSSMSIAILFYNLTLILMLIIYPYMIFAQIVRFTPAYIWILL